MGSQIVLEDSNNHQVSITPKDGATEARTVTLPDNVADLEAANTFSAAQRTSYSTEDNSIDFATNNDFKITLGSSLVVTVENVVGCSGQSGIIIISDIENVSGWSGFTWLGTIPTMTTGVGIFGYKIDGTTVYIAKVENV